MSKDEIVIKVEGDSNVKQLGGNGNGGKKVTDHGDLEPSFGADLTQVLRDVAADAEADRTTGGDVLPVPAPNIADS
jgi:hypothetical protein